MPEPIPRRRGFYLVRRFHRNIRRSPCQEGYCLNSAGISIRHQWVAFYTEDLGMTAPTTVELVMAPLPSAWELNNERKLHTVQQAMVHIKVSEDLFAAPFLFAHCQTAEKNIRRKLAAAMKMRKKNSFTVSTLNLRFCRYANIDSATSTDFGVWPLNALKEAYRPVSGVRKGQSFDASDILLHLITGEIHWGFRSNYVSPQKEARAASMGLFSLLTLVPRPFRHGRGRGRKHTAQAVRRHRFGIGGRDDLQHAFSEEKGDPRRINTHSPPGLHINMAFGRILSQRRIPPAGAGSEQSALPHTPHGLPRSAAKCPAAT